MSPLQCRCIFRDTLIISSRMCRAHEIAHGRNTKKKRPEKGASNKWLSDIATFEIDSRVRPIGSYRKILRPQKYRTGPFSPNRFSPFSGGVNAPAGASYLKTTKRTSSVLSRGAYLYVVAIRLPVTCRRNRRIAAIERTENFSRNSARSPSYTNLVP